MTSGQNESYYKYSCESCGYGFGGYGLLGIPLPQHQCEGNGKLKLDFKLIPMMINEKYIAEVKKLILQLEEKERNPQPPKPRWTPDSW